MKFFAACVLLIGAASLQAQTPTVPDQIQFAGITLTIRDDAKSEIQKDVNLLTQHAGYFSVKTDRAKMFFPIIEKIFEEENVPADFKFLALQESSLVADAVSSSNAVGFWQFKDFTAMEMGLRVDEHIDERMNVVSATRGAAKYLTKNNLQFNNWIYTLQSYQMGAGGVKKAVADLQNGVNEMEVTASTYWYVKRFLAHKIAFENSLSAEVEMKLIPYSSANKKSLKEIANESVVDEATLKDYNKWLKVEVIPDDKEYTVIVPVGKLNQDFNKLWLTSSKKQSEQIKPVIKKADTLFMINGIPAIAANTGDNLNKLAARGKIDLNDLLKFNEIESMNSVRPGTIFLLDKKKNSTVAEYHKAKKGETLWSVSQAYGIKLKKVKKFNQLVSDSLAVGEIVWLGSNRPVIQESPETEVFVLNNSETFDWAAPTAQEELIVTNVINGTSKVETLAQDTVLDINTIFIGGEKNNSHVILAKETLYSIANQYNLKITDLLKWNALNINDKLKPGQTLVLVDPNRQAELVAKAAGNAESIHKVMPSDTLYSIARQYGVTIRNIMEWNNKKDFTLSQGETLQIREK